MSVRKVLEDLLSGRLSVEEAERKLKLLSLEELAGLGKLDINREARAGAPEAVFGEGKSVEQIFKRLSFEQRCVPSQHKQRAVMPRE